MYIKTQGLKTTYLVFLTSTVIDLFVATSESIQPTQTKIFKPIKTCTHSKKTTISNNFYIIIKDV